MLPETRGKPLPDFINKETSEQEQELVVEEDKNEEVTGYTSAVQSGRLKYTVFINEQQGLQELSSLTQASQLCPEKPYGCLRETTSF